MFSNPRRDGLPVTPRSRSGGRSTQDESSSSYSHDSSARQKGLSLDRYARPQRSLVPMPPLRDHSGRPPMSQSQQVHRPYSSSRAHESPSVNRKESNASSFSVVSSHTSSLLDRSKRHGNESSRTSLEDDYESPRSRRGHNSKAKDSRQLYERHNHEDSSATDGVGYTLWSRLATAAGTLSLDVSNAWAANATLTSGEETPPGRESRLTRAMKAYHLEKARDPSDLPEWLFEEHERRPVGRLRFTGKQQDNRRDHEEVSEWEIPAPRSRGLRNIYDSTTDPLNSTGRPNRRIVNRFDDQPTPPSKTTDRLKALRDAKRQNNRFDEDPHYSSRGSERHEGQEIETAYKRSYPRIGLPSSPGPLEVEPEDTKL